ncbi:MAG: MSEP-CTERM sorting domain-containing protein [Gammaproteobacteria bacterium]|nr:MSEP-CTERM sorting domain-containing protein [Gammaproteobacteria bacterium]
MNTDQTLPTGKVPISILWGMTIPQIILLGLNLYGWSLISGEAGEQEANNALLILAVELVILFAGGLVLFLQRKGNIQPGWKIALGLLIGHASYMWLFLVSIGSVVPASIQPWILNEGNVGRWNITLFMPGAFLSLYALSKIFFSRFSSRKSSLIVLLVTIGMPVTWYLLASLMQPVWLGQYSVIVSIFIGTLIVATFLAAIIHLFDKIIHKPASENLVKKYYLISILLGLAAPLGGLALNRQIPFPADFQSVGVYALTIANGVILLLKPGGVQFLSTRLFFRCMAIPFILYFFLVFLPFLPLSLFAILAVGAGFLMLTPLALGLFQTRITLDEYRLAKIKVGYSKANLIAFLGLLVLPGYFAVQAILDKQALDTSLEYFYSHDISAERLSAAEIDRSANALLQLRDRKSDIQLPYISGIYNAVVFGDMVLSDQKISRMYQLLTGADLPEIKQSPFGLQTHSRRNFARPNVMAPRQDVSISNVQVSQIAENRSTVALTLLNASDDTHSLFVTQMDIPDGVFISGLRLKIEGAWVTGKIFDRKTALWVFQKITEVRKDPALLYYLPSGQVELRVYPFPNMGIREVEIDFEYHPQIDSRITISRQLVSDQTFGDQIIDLNPTFNTPSIVAQSGVALVDEISPGLTFQRNPYIHFILDYSAQANISKEQYAKKIISVKRETGIAKYRITAANIGTSDAPIKELIETSDIAQIVEHIESIPLPLAGGLWVQQAIAKEIMRIDETINQDTFTQTPVFVVVSDQNLHAAKDMTLDAWSWLIPDMRGWYSYSGYHLRWHKLGKNKADAVDEPASPTAVIAIQGDSGISIYAADKSSIYRTNADSGLSVYNPTEDRFTPLIASQKYMLNDSNWASYATTWSDWRLTNLNPSIVESERGAFLERSRTQNLLLPLTSFIVVESPSQWEILKRKEKQSLSNHSGLDFEEEQQTPEPPWWLLLAGLLIYLYFRERNTTNSRTKISGPNG